MARRRRRRQHGTGQVYESSPGSWAVRWREGGRRRFRAGFNTREDAERVLDKIRGEVAQGRAGMPPDARGFPALSALGDEWMKRRERTHRAWRDDKCRWTKHLRPFLGRYHAAEVDAAMLRRFIEEKLAEGLNPATVGHCIRLLSTMFSDLVERPRETGTTANPVRTLPRSTRRLYRPTHDPKDTPFLERLQDVRKVYLALRDGDPEHDLAAREQTAVAFAVGAFAGLRTGEVLGLDWRDVDLDARRLLVRQQVQDSRLGPLKDDESRVVPIQAALLPVLAAWKLKTGGEGLLFRPEQPGRRAGRGSGVPATFVRPSTLHAHLADALAACRLPPLTWYQSTRHTFASQWVMANGSIEKLAAVLGHSSTEVTRRYARLRPDLFRDSDYRLLDLPLDSPGQVVALANDGAEGGAVGQRMARDGHGDDRAAAVSSR